MAAKNMNHVIAGHMEAERARILSEGEESEAGI